MTDFADVQTILDAQLDTVTGIPTITKENEKISTISGSFGRAIMQPATTIAESIGVTGFDRLNGIYVVDLFYPKDAGVADPNADVDAITIAFEAGSIFISGANQVEIFNSYPGTTAPDLEKFYRAQVIVEWRARRQRSV